MAESEEDEIQSELARGEFDLRPGRGSSREKPLKIYVMIAVVIVVVLGGLITAWSWAISKITEPIAPVETHVKGDETLESRPAVDTGMERRQAEVIKKNEEEKKKAEEEERKKAETPPPNTAPPSAPRSGSNQAKAPEYDPAKDPMVRKLGGGFWCRQILKMFPLFLVRQIRGKRQAISRGDFQCHPMVILKRVLLLQLVGTPIVGT